MDGAVAAALPSRASAWAAPEEWVPREGHAPVAPVPEDPLDSQQAGRYRHCGG